jgi:coatomer subunit beta
MKRTREGSEADIYREVVEKFPALRPTITEKLVATFPEIKAGKVYRGAMWIVGEYCETAAGE